jgi:hypothetical protein
MKDPNRLCVGIADIGYEIDRNPATVSHMIKERRWYWTITQSVWPVQSEAWLADVEASRTNGQKGGRRPTVQWAGSNVLTCPTAAA